MTAAPHHSGDVRPIGLLHGCILDVLSDSLWHVETDLAVAGIHAEDPSPAVLSGLERALGGGFTGLRGAGVLSGRLGETLLLSKPPKPIRAGAVLILGLGQAESVSAETMRRAAHVAADQAARIQVKNVASACGSEDGAGASASAMPHLWAAIAGIEGVLRTRQHVRRWSFLSRAADLDRFAETFRTAFNRAIGSTSPIC
ncbi:hypothetical protein LHA26_16400 [Sphingomonas morindae]|uniref:Peptidase M17 leucyl aminopeptidase N-terminal domain-containing protein n=2 Tax=Sphingomonas morindae TaxID=1541170 RepID=A0ABY4XCQ4_9SPHN|nr:hypothetical protein LHA26_16400 [Sphingomonas morindae]